MKKPLFTAALSLLVLSPLAASAADLQTAASALEARVPYFYSTGDNCRVIFGTMDGQDGLVESIHVQVVKEKDGKDQSFADSELFLDGWDHDVTAEVSEDSITLTGSPHDQQPTNKTSIHVTKDQRVAGNVVVEVKEISTKDVDGKDVPGKDYSCSVKKAE